MPAWSPNEQTIFVAPRATTFTVVCEACRVLGDGRHLGGTLEREVEVASFRCRRGHRLRVIRAVPLPVSA
jgi:hypothetical protein